MEFFETARCHLSAEQLQQMITGPQLSAWCASIDRVLEWEGERGEMYCLWGQFQVNREHIRDGLRFTLPHCPNALAWTLTSENDAESGRPAEVLVHCTINRAVHEPDFIESIETFVEDWRLGLEKRGR
ncbi:hypothetical protein [Thiocapsa sp. UBA6158]|jgi:hypothetical protein|uniref:hypothetical protein n=1 Tax=Thiocapsa sp. UBA6158 TaxID=1947692 RepID=UPI0025DE8A0B|nr:hypothetical protein [Thiocapsa sp. UBA6158]